MKEVMAAPSRNPLDLSPRRRRRRAFCVLLAGALFVGVGLATSVRAGPKDKFLPPPPGPDRDFYVERIAPWVEEQCASCHRRGGGALLLQPDDGRLSETKRRRADFEHVKAFVNSRVPRESRLFLKVLY